MEVLKNITFLGLTASRRYVEYPQGSYVNDTILIDDSNGVKTIAYEFIVEGPIDLGECRVLCSNWTSDDSTFHTTHLSSQEIEFVFDDIKNYVNTHRHNGKYEVIDITAEKPFEEMIVDDDDGNGMVGFTGDNTIPDGCGYYRIEGTADVTLDFVVVHGIIKVRETESLTEI